MYYLICCCVSFVIGCMASYLFQKYVSVEVKIKKINVNPKMFEDARLQNIQIMLNEINHSGILPIKIPKAAEKSLMIIAKTKDWEKQIDEETIKTLNKIYNSWQMYLKNKGKISSGAKTVTGGGFDVDYWEGSEEEYQEALKNGKINENTKCRICQYERYTLDENGNWEESE